MSTTAQTPIETIVHTRDEADSKLLEGAYRPNGVISRVHGLVTASQVALQIAAKEGKRIVTTGLPLDIAGSLGRVTIVRAWDKTRPDGSRSMGSTPPQEYYAMTIKNVEAFEALEKSDLFKAAFSTSPPADEEAI